MHRSESQYNKTNHKAEFHRARNFFSKNNELAIQQHVRKGIDDNKGNQSKVYKIADSILHRSKENPLPEADSIPQLCNTFGDFFQSKILKIRDSFDSNSNSLYMYSSPEHETPV